MTFNRSILLFLLSSVWPLIIILLLLSIGLNAFFLLIDRFAHLPPAQQSQIVPPSVPTDDSFARGPVAFGTVNRGFALKTQGSIKDATPPVSSYVHTTAVLPLIPASMMLYRDQGYEVDRALIESVFRGLRAPTSVLSSGLFTKSLTLRSVDFVTTVTLDAERRILTIARAPLTPPPSQDPMDDATSIAVAREFADSLGIDTKDFGTPEVRDVRDQQGASKVFVVWKATFDGLPLLDADLTPLERLSVSMSRQTHTALSARLSLLDPGALARSMYPVTTKEVLDRALASGGLLPVAPHLSGTPVVADYSSLDLAYMVIPSDREYPLYIAPVLRAVWSMKPTCKGCVLGTYATFVPLLDPSSFAWNRPSVASSASVSSSAPMSSLASSSSRPKS